MDLRKTLSKLQEENAKLKDSPTLKSKRSSMEDIHKDATKLLQQQQAIEELKKENLQVKKASDLLKVENEKLRNALAEAKKGAANTDYYKNLAESKFKECSKLAEEIICLRSDLDRCQSDYLKMHRARSALVKPDDALFSGRIVRRSSLKTDKDKSNKKKEVSWKAELEEVMSPAKSPMRKSQTKIGTIIG